jgi:DNA-binding MarR family transcriptional regulator
VKKMIKKGDLEQERSPHVSRCVRVRALQKGLMSAT